jgi:hypothetical protein
MGGHAAKLRTATVYKRPRYCQKWSDKAAVNKQPNDSRNPPFQTKFPFGLYSQREGELPVDTKLVVEAKQLLEEAKNRDRCEAEAKACAGALSAYQSSVAELDGSHPNWNKAGAVVTGIGGFILGVAITGASFGGAGAVGCGVAVVSVEAGRSWWDATDAYQAKLELAVRTTTAALVAAIAALKACLN